MDRMESFKPLRMGVQISRSVYSEVPSQVIVCAVAAACARGISASYGAKGEPGFGRPSDG